MTLNIKFFKIKKDSKQSLSLQLKLLTQHTQLFLIFLVIVLSHASCKTCECPAYSQNAGTKTEHQPTGAEEDNIIVQNIIQNSKHIHNTNNPIGHFGDQINY